MIRRVINWLAALVTVAIVVLTVMHFGSYRSMLASDGATDSESAKPAAAATRTAGEEVDRR